MRSQRKVQDSMPRLYMSQVKDSAINEMGRMGCEDYTLVVAAALRALTDGLGLGREFLSANQAGVFVADSYRRYHREQFAGAVIGVDGGIIAAEPSAFAVHLSVVNDDSGELAATSLEKLKICKIATRAPMALPGDLVERMNEIAVGWPESGRPDKLGLGPLPVSVNQEVAARQLASSPVVGVTEQYCDTHGFMLPQHFQTYLTSAMPEVEGVTGIHEFPGGERLGRMTVESRSTLFQMPRLGDRLQTYAAISHVSETTCHWRYWTFNVGTGDVVHLDQLVSATFDLNGRKIVPTPLQIRRRMEQLYHPDRTEAE